MSIERTKILNRKVQTPLIDTEEILVQGQTLKLFDQVNLSPMLVLGKEEHQINIGSSHHDRGNYPKIFLNNTGDSPIPLKTRLTGLKIKTVYSNDFSVGGYIVIFVYGKKTINGETTYTFLGASNNYDCQEQGKEWYTYKFDGIPLYNRFFVETGLTDISYDEIILRPFAVAVSTILDPTPWTEEDTLWERFQVSPEPKHDKKLRIAVVKSGHANATPQGAFNQFVRVDNNYSPHVIISYKQEVFIYEGDLIYHNENESRHLNPNEKEYLISSIREFKNYQENFRGEVFDVNQKLNGTRYSNEQILSFFVNVENYRNNSIKTVSIKRNIGDSGFTGAFSAQNDVYLIGEVFNADNEKISIISSTNVNRQQAQDNGVTTWLFDNVLINSSWKRIKFSVSTVQDVVQSNKSIRTRYVNNKSYLQGNSTIESDGVERNYTTDFRVGFSDLITRFSQHCDDNNKHITDVDRQKLDSFGNHVSNTNIHLTTSQKQFISNHIGDTDIHVSAAQKTSWNSAVAVTNTMSSQLSTVKMDVQRLLRAYDEGFSTKTEEMILDDRGKTQTHCIQISSAHFTSGVIKSISIPYSGGKGLTGYLCVQIFFEGESDSTKKELSDCYFSINPETQTNGGSGQNIFYFTNLTIPDKYKFIRFMIVPTKQVAPNVNFDIETTPSFRIRILTKNDTYYFDDDDCQIWDNSTSSTNYLVMMNCVKVISPINTINDISTIIQRLENEIIQLRGEVDELKGNTTI